MPILAPFQAFARDAAALNVEEDESRLPVRWLAAAQVAARIADSRPHERKSLLKIWVQQQQEDGPDGVWSALAVPGIPVRDLASASAALCHIAADMERGGALNLAYSTVTHMRISMLERGPAGARGLATLQQARVLRQMGLLEEAHDTYGEAREDAVRANDRELEGRALLGLGVVAGHRGNLPEVVTLAKAALSVFPDKSEYTALAYGDLTVASIKLRDYPAALEYGWRAYDLSANEPERRAAMVANLSSLALRMGRSREATTGYSVALKMTPLERIQLPALGGLALASAATRNLGYLAQVHEWVERLAASSTLPYELAGARFELAEAWKEVGNFEKAEECLTSARDLSLRHGFNEVSFRSEMLADALKAANAASTAQDERIERSIARFDALAASESALATA